MVFYVSVLSSPNYYSSVIKSQAFLRSHAAPGNALGSGEAKMYGLKIPVFEQLWIWYNTSAEVFNCTHFKACGFAIIILWKMYSVLWGLIEGFSIPSFCTLSPPGPSRIINAPWLRNGHVFLCFLHVHVLLTWCLLHIFCRKYPESHLIVNHKQAPHQALELS